MHNHVGRALSQQTFGNYDSMIVSQFNLEFFCITPTQSLREADICFCAVYFPCALAYTTWCMQQDVEVLTRQRYFCPDNELKLNLYTFACFSLCELGSDFSTFIYSFLVQGKFPNPPAPRPPPDYSDSLYLGILQFFTYLMEHQIHSKRDFIPIT